MAATTMPAHAHSVGPDAPTSPASFFSFLHFASPVLTYMVFLGMSAYSILRRGGHGHGERREVQVSKRAVGLASGVVWESLAVQAVILFLEALVWMKWGVESDRVFYIFSSLLLWGTLTISLIDSPEDNINWDIYGRTYALALIFDFLLFGKNIGTGSMSSFFGFLGFLIQFSRLVGLGGMVAMTLFEVKEVGERIEALMESFAFRFGSLVEGHGQAVMRGAIDASSAKDEKETKRIVREALEEFTKSEGVLILVKQQPMVVSGDQVLVLRDGKVVVDPAVEVETPAVEAESVQDIAAGSDVEKVEIDIKAPIPRSVVVDKLSGTSLPSTPITSPIKMVTFSFGEPSTASNSGESIEDSSNLTERPSLNRRPSILKPDARPFIPPPHVIERLASPSKELDNGVVTVQTTEGLLKKQFSPTFNLKLPTAPIFKMPAMIKAAPANENTPPVAAEASSSEDPKASPSSTDPPAQPAPKKRTRRRRRRSNRSSTTTSTAASTTGSTSGTSTPAIQILSSATAPPVPVFKMAVENAALGLGISGPAAVSLPFPLIARKVPVAVTIRKPDDAKAQNASGAAVVGLGIEVEKEKTEGGVKREGEKQGVAEGVKEVKKVKFDEATTTEVVKPVEKALTSTTPTPLRERSNSQTETLTVQTASSLKTVNTQATTIDTAPAHKSEQSKPVTTSSDSTTTPAETKRLVPTPTSQTQPSTAQPTTTTTTVSTGTTTHQSHYTHTHANHSNNHHHHRRRWGSSSTNGSNGGQRRYRDGSIGHQRRNRGENMGRMRVQGQATSQVAASVSGNDGAGSGVGLEVRKMEGGVKG